MTTQTEALKLALEALDQLTNAADTFSVSGVYFNEGVWAKKCLSDAYFAITAIEQALAQPEQDKERCVGCEACIDTACGRDECPKGWPKAAQPEQESVAFSKEQMQIYADANYEAGYSIGYMDCAVKTHQNKNPVAYVKASELEELKHCNGMSLWAENAAIHTDDSISKQLLPSGHVPVYTTPPQRKPPEAGDGHDLFYEAVRLLDNAVFAQSGDVVRHDSAAHREALNFFNHVFTRLDMTPPPQRTWVWLTDDEIWKDDAIMAANSGYGATFDTLRDIVRAIEAKLKEKNT